MKEWGQGGHLARGHTTGGGSPSGAPWLGLIMMCTLTGVIAATPVLRPVPGLGCSIGFVPRLAPWANFFRPSGLGVGPISGGWFE